MKTTEYLAALKASKGITSDYGLAKLLRVSPQAIHKYQTGEVVPGPLVAFRVADALQRPRDQVVADFEIERAERAGRPEVVSGWGELMRVAACVIASAGLYGGAGDAQATSPALSVADAPQSVYYVNRLMGWIGRIRRFLQTPLFSIDCAPAAA